MAKILVIEDEIAIAELLQLKLSELNHKVLLAAEWGAQALTLALNEKLDLFILDFNVPGATGAQVHKWLRENPSTAKTPIIFMTGVSIIDVITSVNEDAKTRFLEKPPDFALLAKTINNLLSPV